jgi:hypothetical protein
MTTFPWEVRASLAARDVIALFIGSIKVKNPNSSKVRRALADECRVAPKGTCIWQQTSHACDGVVNQTDAIYLFLRARCCLAPPGDSLTRKSIFDSLLAGCVPVVFIRSSLTQYDWHLSRADFERVSVYIPMKDVLHPSKTSGSSFMDILTAIPIDELLYKQREIAKLAPRLQYAVVYDLLHVHTHSTVCI